MKRLLREPLLHFLLLGAAIFVVESVASRGSSEDAGKIVISERQIEAMAENFATTWRRPPTSDDLEGLIRDRVQEEVYYREAMALGLEKDDTIIRRRLRQKLEFLTDDIAALAEPTEEELSAFLTAHAEKFRSQRQLTFSHVYLNPERHGENLARESEKLLAQLRLAGESVDLAGVGDPFLLEHQFVSLAASEVAKQFGEPFAARLGQISLGQWQGPVESGYGAHLVLVSDRTEGRLPALSEVRDAVRSEWANARRLEANQNFYRGLLERYVVTIERPVSAEAKSVAAAR